MAESTALLARIDDLERAFIDACREVRAVLVATDHERDLVTARLEEARRQLDALRPAVPLIARVESHRKRIEKACEHCREPFLGRPTRRFCDDCFREQARVRMRALLVKQRAAASAN